MTKADPRIIEVTLDESSILRWNADIDHERRVAIFDLLEKITLIPSCSSKVIIRDRTSWF